MKRCAKEKRKKIRRKGITYVDEFVVQCREFVPLGRDGNSMRSGSRLKMMDKKKINIINHELTVKAVLDLCPF